jgi:ABC-type Zn uptake system ZnuABC Zn-binding protein ZnuA
VATTTIVGDVVAQVGGKHIDLSVLLPVGTDPHSFDPTPQDVAKAAEADLIFANGAGLEEFLDNLIESAGAEAKVLHLSEGLDLLALEADSEHEEDDHDQASADPHTWTDPQNVITWVEAVVTQLSTADPDNADSYTTNAATYTTELETLDAWIAEQVAHIPEGSRKIVSDHTQWSYFAAAYGFEQIGALIPGFSTLAEPSAKELAAIEDAIADLDVGAIFVGNTVNPTLAERVTADTGTQLVFVYTGSLSAAGEGAATYIEYMHYNTNAFVEALK